MPKKKIMEPLTHDKMRESALNKFMNDNYGSYRPEPTYFFGVGDSATLGHLKNLVIISVGENGKYYEIEHGDGSSRERRFAWWYDLRPITTQTNSLVRDEDLSIHFQSQSIYSLLNKAYFFGIDFDPEYQRGYVWNDADKESLIDSIFGSIDIGKFVFIRRDFERRENDTYEVLDGKQRMRTILDYFENRFSYNGVYFNELSASDQDYFETYGVSVAEVAPMSLEQKIRYFLKLNRSGRVMDKEHLNKVEKMLIK